MLLNSRTFRRASTRFFAAAAVVLAASALLSPAVSALEPLDFWEYTALQRSAHRLDKMALVGSLEDENGVYAVIGDRFGLVRLYYLTHHSSQEIWSSKQLNGVVHEVLVVDLDGDGSDEIVAWTSSALIYVWDATSRRLRYETLATDFETLHALTVGQVDDDAPYELIVNADNRIYYLDGESFNREWTSLNEFECTRMVCGDVDGDGNRELVLNTGQVLDSRSGDVEWEDEVFGSRIELADIDGDGIPEVLSESDGTVLKVYDVDHRKEKHLQ